MYEMPKWNNPGRQRNCKAKYTDKDYCKYYDLDIDDLTNISVKLSNGIRLTDKENDRYGIYLYTICYMVLENPKFKNKPKDEKSELVRQGMFELLNAIPKFDINRGSSIYSFVYRCCYVAYCHYYTDKISDYKHKQEIDKHCTEEWVEYMEEFSSHKVSNLNKE